jgi:RNA ligase
MNLDDLIDPLDLKLAVEVKDVSTQRHPTLPLTIYNYTTQCQFRRNWTPTTRLTRGLIVRDDGVVVARSFPKFFTYGDPLAPSIGPDDLVGVTDKVDGSLGIVYPTPAGPAVATKASFQSEQAVHATKIWWERYKDVLIPVGVTPLVEIVYPSNRVVVDYHGMDDLVLLGGMDIDTGWFVRADRMAAWMSWPGPVAEQFGYTTFAEVVAAPPREGKEGLVVQLVDGERVKIKQDDYLALHRILTEVTTRRIWEFLAVEACWDQAKPKEGKTPADYLESKLHLDRKRIEQCHATENWKEAFLQNVPAAFEAWLNKTVEDLTAKAKAAYKRVARDYGSAVMASGLDFEEVKKPENRHQFVKAAQEVAVENWRLTVTMLDGNEFMTWAWLQCYPEHEKPFTVEEP